MGRPRSRGRAAPRNSCGADLRAAHGVREFGPGAPKMRAAAGGMTFE